MSSAIMNGWEFLRVSVFYREDDKIDFISKRDKNRSAITTTQDGMETHFNAEQREWDSYLRKLKADGWELADVNRRDDGRHEVYSFKRTKRK